MIALGVSIGSGEWLLGPLGFGRFGFIGLGFLVTSSAILQTFYNVENARYTMATGEVARAGFTRTPPGLKVCGACRDVCAVRIDLPGLLLKLRHETVQEGHTSAWLKVSLKIYTETVKRPWLYRWGAK